MKLVLKEVGIQTSREDLTIYPTKLAPELERIPSERPAYQMKTFPLMAGFDAKTYCSCRFVTGMNAKACEEYMNVFPHFRSIQEVGDSVNVTVMGKKRTATYLDRERGCTLK